MTTTIRASRSEAPSVSRASQLNSTRFGRPLEALSSGERDSILLALYHPALFDLHEQFALSPAATFHPLHTHPDMAGKALPAISGSLEIAARLGVLALHPKVKVPASIDEHGVEEAEYWAPVSWIGDLLLYLIDESGPYCVHWDVKLIQGAHGKPGPGSRNIPGSLAFRRAAARLKVVDVYFQEAGIRSIAVAKASIDRQVAYNLRQLNSANLRSPEMTLSRQEDLILRLEDGLRSGTPPIKTFNQLVNEASLSFFEFRRVFYQAIWLRRLRVDLYKPVLIDRPLRPEVRDVLEEYKQWFER